MTSTLSLSVDTAQSQSTRLEIVAQQEDWVGIFDVIEVWRSRSTQRGPFEELTAERFKPARIPKNALDQPDTLVTGTQVALTGKTLSVLLNEADQIDILFTGVDPLTYGDAAHQITAKSLGRLSSYVAEDGRVVLETKTPGTGASLRILPSEAAPILRLPTEEPDSLDYGHDARIQLVEGQDLYVFVDLMGSSEYFYRTRFRNTQRQAVSAFSDAFSIGEVVGIDQQYLAYGVVDLIDLSGVPIKDQEVRVHTTFRGVQVDGRVVAGSDVVKKTDADGHVEFQLVRGQKVSVAIIGTDLVRDILVPEDQEVKRFNLLAPEVGVGEDNFKVMVPDIIYAERRSL